ncbi:hypothetical protein HYR69_10020 [Candidatus Sumerlaeota bacterium]|nr:hypothetical protein [Candidatus Sumerlaeota bacterium]
MLALCLPLLLAACVQTRPKPQVVIHADGSVTSYKRYERYPQRDFFNHFVRKAYFAPHDSDFHLAGPEQKNILEQWGQPNYIRKSFRSLQDERVEEWVYLEQRRIFQFVKHAVAFEGDLTDLEQLLIRLGYPDRMITLIGESGIERTTLYYGNIFVPGRHDTFELADGWIIHSEEGN